MRHELEGFRCKDCGKCTYTLNEYYMVTDSVWDAALPDRRTQRRMLCIGCLERRLGRELEKQDFTDCRLNQEEWPQARSGRLKARLGHKP